MTRNRKRALIAIAATLTVLGAAVVATVVQVQPRCCLTFANARMFLAHGYFPGLNARQVEDAIYAQCFSLPCQWQPELPVGACPSQWGVEQVAASWGMPGYVNPAQWNKQAVIADADAGRAIVFWPVGGIGHAYYCSDYIPNPDPAAKKDDGTFWCIDALNQGGRYWTAEYVWSVWSGWSAGWRP